MAALHILLTSVILTGTATSLIIMKTKSTVERSIRVMKTAKTEFALLRHILSSARSHLYKRGIFKEGNMARMYQ